MRRSSLISLTQELIGVEHEGRCQWGHCNFADSIRSMRDPVPVTAYKIAYLTHVCYVIPPATSEMLQQGAKTLAMSAN